LQLKRQSRTGLKQKRSWKTPSETIKLTAKFKLKETPEGLDGLFQTYREIVNFLITHAFENSITSFYRLKKETYKSLRKEHPELPSQSGIRLR